MANTSAPNGKALAWTIREEDLEDLEALKRDLLAKGEQARGDGRLYLSAQYTRMIALVSPEIKRIRDRWDRETLANVRKEEAALKLEARNTAQAEKEAQGRA